MKKMTDIILDGILYRALWKRNLLAKILYILIPFILITSFGLILYFRNAFSLDEGYGFLDDFSNCYMLIYIFFFMYFVSGLFIPYFDKIVDKFGRKHAPLYYIEHRKFIKNVRLAFFILEILVTGFALIFILVAKRTGNVNWYSNLSDHELKYYSFLIILSWFMTAKLFISVLISSITLYKYTKSVSEELNYYHLDKKCGLKELYTALSASMGFGVYFLIAVAMILYSDYRAYNEFQLELEAYSFSWLIISITIILSVIYYAIIILTYIHLNTVMKNTIKKKLKNSKKLCSGHEEYLRSIASTTISLNNVFVFVLSILFPGISAIIQVLSPFILSK